MGSRRLARGLDIQLTTWAIPDIPPELEGRCHRGRQKPWKLLRNQNVAGRTGLVIGRCPSHTWESWTGTPFLPSKPR
jgi:hypothetical protein